MVFTAKSPKINIEEVRALSKLEGQALERKSQRDQELEAIIRGEDQRILLVSGHAHLTMKKLSLSTLSVWQFARRSGRPYLYGYACLHCQTSYQRRWL